MPESKSIFILTGPVQTGKTTSLISWSKGRKGVYGIAQPIINGRRCLIDLISGETKLLEVDKRDESVIEVGNFSFSIKTFDWAKKTLQNASAENPEWLVIDEYGKLELDNKGLEPAVTLILSDDSLLVNTKLLIVVRDYLLERFIQKLILDNSKVNIIHDLNALP